MKALLVPVIVAPEVLIVMPEPAVFSVTETVHIPLLKEPVLVGLIVPVVTVRVFAPVYPVITLFVESTAVMVMMKGAPATWLPIVLKLK